MSTVGLEVQLNDLARQFAGGADDAKILALAEVAAYAQLDLERIRKVHTAMIECALMKNTFGGVRHFRSNMEELLRLVTQTGRREEMRGVRLPQPVLVGSSIPLPEGEEEGKRRFAEAIRHILSELTKIYRYEKRAAGRRDRAIGKIVAAKVRRRGES